MDREHVKGTADKAKGVTKDTAVQETRSCRRRSQPGRGCEGRNS
jgi:hypothetical protein